MGFVPKPARQVGAAPLPEPSQPAPGRSRIVLTHYRKPPPSPALWLAMSVEVLRGAAPNGNSKYWSSGRRRCGEWLLASDPVAVTVEAINIIPNHSDWPPDILRTVTSAPGTINIAGVWNAA